MYLYIRSLYYECRGSITRHLYIPKNIFAKLANINERRTHNLEIFKRGKRDDEGGRAMRKKKFLSRRISRELWIFQRREYCKLS